MTKKTLINLLAFTAILSVGGLVGYFFHPFSALLYLFGCFIVVIVTED